MSIYEIENENKEISCELVVKKSRFIAKVYYVDNVETINNLIDKKREEYNDAKHVVYAYRLLNTAKFSDDKEPPGTAGKPIYNLLEKENLVNVLIIVIRYFGGVLLGTGPLRRAYGRVANELLKLCTKKEYIRYVLKEITCEYKEEESIKRDLINNGYIIEDITHLDKVYIKYKIPEKT